MENYEVAVEWIGDYKLKLKNEFIQPMQKKDEGYPIETTQGVFGQITKVTTDYVELDIYDKDICNEFITAFTHQLKQKSIGDGKIEN